MASSKLRVATTDLDTPRGEVAAAVPANLLLGTTVFDFGGIFSVSSAAVGGFLMSPSFTEGGMVIIEIEVKRNNICVWGSGS